MYFIAGKPTLCLNCLFCNIFIIPSPSFPKDFCRHSFLLHDGLLDRQLARTADPLVGPVVTPTQGAASLACTIQRCLEGGELVLVHLENIVKIYKFWGN